ncbi:MAG: TatD family hydrolase [Bacilli bacterium]|nr:TatD family hydrolase [Bacilli bacterium]
MMIDTHCHLCKEDYENVELIIKNMENNKMIAAGVNDATNQEVLELVKKYPTVYGAIGIHPTEVGMSDDASLERIENHLKDNKIVAIGEIGLDYHYGKKEKEKQIEFFKKQLDLARKYQKPVVIHSRDSIEDTYDIMKEYKDLKMILHCYSGSVEMAKRFLELDVYFGIGGVLTFKNSRVLKDVVYFLPLDHILLETDSPYLAPEPYRGSKNEPKNVLLVANMLAELKGISVEEVINITTKNAFSRFDLNKSL